MLNSCWKIILTVNVTVFVNLGCRAHLHGAIYCNLGFAVWQQRRINTWLFIDNLCGPMVHSLDPHSVRQNVNINVYNICIYKEFKVIIIVVTEPATT